MAVIFDSHHYQSKLGRKYIGSLCATCEEPLEHRLRYERILPFSCGHVSHEACFYEYVQDPDCQSCPTCGAWLGLDTSRCGNILNLSNLSNLIRSIIQREVAASPNAQRIPKLEIADDAPPGEYDFIGLKEQKVLEERPGSLFFERVTQRIEYHADHKRDNSADTETNSSPSQQVKGSVPAPLVTIRSEFPTLRRSRQQQNLTCLVTIEVPKGEYPPQSYKMETPSQLFEPNDSNTNTGHHGQIAHQASSSSTSYESAKSRTTTSMDYSTPSRDVREPQIPRLSHVPIDMVVVIPVSSSTKPLKIDLLCDTIRFLIQNLGKNDRMGLVRFGSSDSAVSIASLSTKAWGGWTKILDSLREAIEENPRVLEEKSQPSAVLDGANLAIDLLTTRKASNSISTIFLIGDSMTEFTTSTNAVISRAKAAKIRIYTFGLGLSHKPDILIELSSKTTASYIYVKDWMTLKECVAGCLGALQSTSHQNVKLKLKLSKGSPAKIVKISGALRTSDDAHILFGDLRFGDKRDVLVQLAITPDNSRMSMLPQDPWETMLLSLEGLREEVVPLLQASLVYEDAFHGGSVTTPPQTSLLTITMLPTEYPQQAADSTPFSVSPHPSIVQRRMELLTSDMLTRALNLVDNGQQKCAHDLLHATKKILEGFCGDTTPQTPTSPGLKRRHSSKTHADKPTTNHNRSIQSPTPKHGGNSSPTRPRPRTAGSTILTPPPGTDTEAMHALKADLEASLEWIHHPALFAQDARKAALQAVGVISSQRAYTFRTPSEAALADRVPGVRALTEKAWGY